MYEQEIKSYCHQAQKYLACEKKQRDRFDRLIADSANEFLKESPGSTFEELRAVLGEPQEAAAGVHGTNERIPVRAYLQGIRVLIDLMEHVNLSC